MACLSGVLDPVYSIAKVMNFREILTGQRWYVAATVYPDECQQAVEMETVLAAQTAVFQVAQGERLWQSESRFLPECLTLCHHKHHCLLLQPSSHFDWAPVEFRMIAATTTGCWLQLRRPQEWSRLARSDTNVCQVCYLPTARLEPQTSGPPAQSLDHWSHRWLEGLDICNTGAHIPDSNIRL